MRRPEYSIEERGALEYLHHAVQYLLKRFAQERCVEDWQAASRLLDIQRSILLDAAARCLND